jgi:hypothetical protein
VLSLETCKRKVYALPMLSPEVTRRRLWHGEVVIMDRVTQRTALSHIVKESRSCGGLILNVPSRLWEAVWISSVVLLVATNPFVVVDALSALTIKS